MNAEPRPDRPARGGALVWFREDLRLADNPALTAAADLGGPVTCVYLLDEASDRLRRPGGASRWWLHHSLAALAGSLRELGGALVLRRGAAVDEIPRLARETGAVQVFWNRRYGDAERAIDDAVQRSLQGSGVQVGSFGAKLLNEPGTVHTQTGEPFRVFAPFWRAAQTLEPIDAPLPRPKKLTFASRTATDDLRDWKLLPFAPDWSGGLADAWTPGETAARSRLEKFLSANLAGYSVDRDFPALEASSRLSPHLAFGEISPRQIWAALDGAGDAAPENLKKFRDEMGWRDFAWHLLYHRPDIPVRNANPDFDRFPWLEPGLPLKVWQKGRTGYPLVDAAMRQLWQTGWMHNRLRLVAASFLVKHLLIDWRIGEAWFWDTLVDCDPANNAVGWQWVAGSGFDAAPFFRVFNPVLQSRKFDPDGRFIRRYVPELDRMSDETIHAPWEASPLELEAAGVRLGETYPHPVVSHSQARARALAAYETIRVRSGTTRASALSRSRPRPS